MNVKCAIIPLIIMTVAYHCNFISYASLYITSSLCLQKELPFPTYNFKTKDFELKTKQTSIILRFNVYFF